MAGRRTSGKTGPFPNRVRELRDAAGLTQEEVAARLGYTHSMIGKLERGERQLKLPLIQALSKIFHCHPVEFFQAISSEEREALLLLRAADATTRRRMIQMLKMLVEPLPADRVQVA